MDNVVQPQDRGVLRVLVGLGVAAIDADEGSLLVLDAAKNALVFAMVVSRNEASSTPLEGQAIPVGKGLTGLAAMTREVQIGAPTYVVGQELREGEGPEAVIAAPMLIDDECVGVITAVSYQTGRRFTAKDAALYGQLSTIAALVVQQRQQLAVLRSINNGTELTDTAQVAQEAQQWITRIATKAPSLMPSLSAMLAAMHQTVARDQT